MWLVFIRVRRKIKNTEYRVLIAKEVAVLSSDYEKSYKKIFFLLLGYALALKFKKKGKCW